MNSKELYNALYWLIVIGLIAAKLIGWINCSWWLVTLPLWLPLVIALTLMILIVGICLTLGGAFLFIILGCLAANITKIIEAIKEMRREKDPKPF